MCICVCAQQNLKDSIVVTTVGAEALPFLEAYGVLPASLLFFMFFKFLVRASIHSSTCCACMRAWVCALMVHVRMCICLLAWLCTS